MRILMTGATGLIGRELGKALAARGDTLVCLVRDIGAARRRLPFPAECHAWDHTRAVPAEALHGVDAVVNLAGEPVADTRWTPAKKVLIRDSRVQGTQQLVRAVLQHGPGVATFVQGSASGYYGERGDERLSASSTKGGGFLAEVVQAWEAELRPLAKQQPQVRVPVVRTGIVLARQGGALAEMLPMFRLSAAGRLGAGRQWMSWIHLDDIVGLFTHALDGAPSGILEGVAPQPATNRQFTTALCRSLGVWEQWLPHAAEDIWPFFCDANNLEDITPPFLAFRVLGMSTPVIGAGTLIDYRLRLNGIPIAWQTRIDTWDPPRRFIDLQAKGPYALWHHTHEFIPMGGGTLMRDTVRYHLPAGWLGALAGGIKVAADVERIFDFRAHKIDERFGA
jgi:uncharacterized protein (TIGR01777 family)